MEEFEKAIFQLLKRYFDQYDVASLQKRSYDHFITHRLPKIIEEEPTIQVALKKNEFYRVEFGQIFIGRPYIVDEKRVIQYILPSEAMIRDLTYSSVFSINISTKHYTVDDDGVENVLEEKNYFKIPIARIPMMVGCCRCNLQTISKKEQHQKGQCENDYGGYFIIKGKERVLVAQERINYNTVYIFEKKTTDQKHLMVGEIRSMSDETGHSILIQMKICVSSLRIVVSLPFISQDIPLGFIFMAYGCPLDCIEDIIRKNIMIDHPDVSIMIKGIMKDAMIIQTEENAIQHIAQYATHVVSKDRRMAYVKQILINEVFPHLGITNDEKQKVYYLGHMCGKLMLTYLGIRPLDDRDHLANKRIEVSGTLVGDLFRTLWKRFIRTIMPQLMKRSDIITIISKVNVITMGLRHCFSTGNWGIPKSNYIRTGVSQVLNRLSYNSTISHLRRIVIPIGKEGRNTKIRQVHPTQIGFVCSSETPEGSSAGIVKNFSLISEVSLNFDPMYIRIILESTPFLITDFNQFNQYETWIKIFINGNWMGIVEDAQQMIRHLQYLKEIQHAIPENTSYVLDGNEIRIYCDEGRMIRPLFDAKKMPTLDEVKTKSWDQLVREGKIRWVDPHEIENKFIAMFPHEIEYDTDYCEIHPCLMIGICASLMPYADHTQSPRICYHASMVKQSIGIYSSTNEIRCDTIAHMLSYPEKPIVKSHVEEWLKMDKLPCGNNVIVAIACYGGWNQEDSIILNKSSVDKGLFRSFSFRTIVVEEKKKTSSHIETIEMPPADIRIRSFNYNKLDKYGIIQPGTFVGSGDVIVAKISTRQTKNGREEKFDTSVIIKDGEEGNVDKVFITTTPDGYKMIKIKIRCLKIPEIGDKLCSNCAQKGTIGMTLNREDMPFTPDGIVPDIIINPLCLTGDTLVGFQDGLSRRLDKSLNSRNSYLWGFQRKTNQFVSAFCMGGEFKSYSEVMRITRSDGIQIRCTPDHKFLLYDPSSKDTYWKPASLIVPHTDYLVCGVELPEDKEEPLDILWVMNRNGSFYEMRNTKDRLACQAMFRLSGFHKSLLYKETPSWNTVDRDLLWDDMELQPLHFTIQTIQNLKIEQDLRRVPRCLCREYIAAFLSLHIEIRKEYTLYAKWDEHYIANIHWVRDIAFYLSIYWNIQSTIRQDNGFIYLIIHDVIAFHEKIGIRYAPKKSLQLSVLACYWRNPFTEWEKFLETSQCSSWWEIDDDNTSSSTQMPFFTCPISESIFLEEKEDTFCIGVEKFHNFIAQGMVVKNCIPSRMTINQLMESLGAKSSSIKGRFRNATTFSYDSVNVVEKLKDELKDCGYERNGNECMINGITGERLEAEIFIGPAYYHRLKHLVSAKIHARNHGKVSQLTRQPLEGRSRAGGLRMGEMERDALISGGMSRFLLERLYELSDPFKIPICAKCGTMPSTNNYCSVCDQSDIRVVPIPYAAKLLFQELNAMGIRTNLFPADPDPIKNLKA